MILKEHISITEDKESVLEAFKEAISRGSTKILYDKNRPHILLQRPISSDTDYSEVLEIFKSIRTHQIEEIDMVPNPFEFFFMVANKIAKKELHINFILVNNLSSLSKWFKHDINQSKQIYGYKVYAYEEVEEDSILIAASNVRIAESFDISYTLKGYIDVK